MKQLGLTLLLVASLSHAQEPGDFRPSETHVWGAEYPRVGSAGRVEVRVKAPGATEVRLNFWSGPKGIEHVCYESPGTDHEWQT